MKKCLLFPPRWSAAHSYLSLPTLKAYLNDKGIQINQYDLNLDEFYYFTSKSFIKKCLKRILDKDLDVEYKEIYLLIYDYIYKNLDEVKNILRDIDTFLDFNNYKKVRVLLEEIHSFISKAFEPFNTNIDHISTGGTLSINSIDEILEDNSSNPYIDFSDLMVEKYNLADYDFIGISVVIPTQIIPALTICKNIKSKNPNVHICIGGSAFSTIYYKINKLKKIFKYFDSILMFEGEETLCKLIINLENGNSLGGIENLIYINNKELIFNEIKKGNIDLESLPVPDFDGLRLRDYASPDIIIPYSISRSCYWGKCTFCEHDFGHDGRYRIKSVDKVVKDIKSLKKRYGAKYFYFVDEAIPPKYLERLSDKLIEEKVDISWFTCIKASKTVTMELCEKMKYSGCVLIYIGVESYSQKVLNDMNKGVIIEDIDISTKNLSDSGIWVHGFLINNYPTEEYLDKLKTILSIYKGNIHSVGLSEFSLTRNSKIMINKIDLNLINQKEDRDFSSKINFEFASRKKENTFGAISSIYSKRDYNRLYPNQIFFREHLPIFLKNYDLINNKSYLKFLIKDSALFDNNKLLYKEVNGSTIIYNLYSKAMFVCELKLKDILDNISNINSISQLRTVISQNYIENAQNLEEMINTIFYYDEY